MSLKQKYGSESEVPAEVKSHYLERDGSWVLDSERNEELRQTNITVMKERDALMKRFEGIDPEEARATALAKLKLEEDAQLKAGEFEKVLAARTQSAVSEEAKKYAPKLAELEVANGLLSKLMIEDAVVAEATKRGLRSTALQDLKARARACFRLVDGVPRIFDGEILRLGADGVSPATVEEWVGGLVSDAPHFFPSNAGGGAAGSSTGGVGLSAGGAGGANPWAAKTRNLTEQMKLLKSDPGLAARLKALAN